MTRAQDLSSDIANIISQCGIPVTASRLTNATQRNVFGTPLDGTPETIQANVIIDSEKVDLLPTLAGGKPKEILKLISMPNTFNEGDEIQYSSHTYKVDHIQPMPFIGTDIADLVQASREVD